MGILFIVFTDVKDVQNFFVLVLYVWDFVGMIPRSGIAGPKIIYIMKIISVSIFNSAFSVFIKACL